MAGILGFSARFAGGGNDALFNFRSDGLSFATWGGPGDRCPSFCSVGTDEANVGVMGRLRVAPPRGTGLGGSPSGAARGGLRDALISSSRSKEFSNPRGGDRGESTVKVGASCGEEWKTMDMGLFWRLDDRPGDPVCRTGSPFVRSKF